jgi:hypothetical protein
MNLLALSPKGEFTFIAVNGEIWCYSTASLIISRSAEQNDPNNQNNVKGPTPFHKIELELRDVCTFFLFVFYKFHIF